MAYEWPKNQIDPMTGLPYSKQPVVYLELTDADGTVIDGKRFETQSEVDWAWENGYHVPRKPETRDVGGVPVDDIVDVGETPVTEDPEILRCDRCSFETIHAPSLKAHMTKVHK